MCQNWTNISPMLMASGGYWLNSKLTHLIMFTALTHCCLVTPYGVIDQDQPTLAKVMACCLTASSPYLNQCWLIISEVLHLNAIWQERFEISILDMSLITATSTRAQWVKVCANISMISMSNTFSWLMIVAFWYSFVFFSLVPLMGKYGIVFGKGSADNTPMPKPMVTEIMGALTHWGLLTHLPLDKMATILADNILKCILLN